MSVRSEKTDKSSQDLSLKAAIQSFSVICASVILLWLLKAAGLHSSIGTIVILSASLLVLGYAYEYGFGSLFALLMMTGIYAENEYDGSLPFPQNIIKSLVIIAAPLLGYGLARVYKAMKR